MHPTGWWRLQGTMAPLAARNTTEHGRNCNPPNGASYTHKKSKAEQKTDQSHTQCARKPPVQGGYPGGTGPEHHPGCQPARALDSFDFVAGATRMGLGMEGGGKRRPVILFNSHLYLSCAGFP